MTERPPALKVRHSPTGAVSKELACAAGLRQHGRRTSDAAWTSQEGAGAGAGTWVAGAPCALPRALQQISANANTDMTLAAENLRLLAPSGTEGVGKSQDSESDVTEVAGREETEPEKADSNFYPTPLGDPKPEAAKPCFTPSNSLDNRESQVGSESK